MAEEANKEATPEDGKTYKIIYNRDECIGAGACAQACPENWEMDEENKARYKKDTISEKELSKNMDAAKVCPVNVIHIEDSEGKRLI